MRAKRRLDVARNAVAFEVSSGDERATQAGAFYFVFHEDKPGLRAGIIHACPCGCGGRSVMWLRGHGRGRQEWDVTGEWPKVTLSPSIGIRPVADGKYHWHGYLENGVFVER